MEKDNDISKTLKVDDFAMTTKDIENLGILIRKPSKNCLQAIKQGKSSFP